MKQIVRYLLGTMLCLFPCLLSAQESESDLLSSESADTSSFTVDTSAVGEIFKALTDTIVPQKEDVVMESEHFTLHVPEGYVFLDKKQTRHLLEDLWGNLPDEEVLGSIVPDSSRLFVTVDAAFLLYFDACGYVKDEDAEEIDYDELLENMQEDIVEGNKEREKMGMETFILKGWAEPPYYDKEKKTLHWAKDLSVQSEEPYECLNYDIRILGKEGYCKWQAVASMEDFPKVKEMCSGIINSVDFEKGYAYSDFNPKTDRIAEWTIGGLVAGKLLAKAGILAKFGAIFAKFGKLIIVALVAAGAAIKKFFFGTKGEEKKSTEEVVMNREESVKKEEEDSESEKKE